MARPIKNTVDYFPHIIQNGKTIFILESKYGNDGYAFWFKLLELLGSSHNHVYDYNNPADWEFMLAKTKVSEEMANNILKTLADLGAIDEELLKKKLIWCENFLKGIEDVYKRRKVEIPQKPVNVNINPVFVNGNPTTGIVSDNKNRQSKVKETKVKKSKEKKERKEVQKSISASLKEDLEKEKKKANKIEFDFESWSWHGIDDDIMDDWEKRFPDINIGEQLMKIREYFKIHPEKEKYIKNYAIYINDWLERASEWKKEISPCDKPKNSDGVCSHLWGSDCNYKCCLECPVIDCNTRCKFAHKIKKGKEGD